jgi:hypothetical protein
MHFLDSRPVNGQKTTNSHLNVCLQKFSILAFRALGHFVGRLSQFLPDRCACLLISQNCAICIWTTQSLTYLFLTSFRHFVFEVNDVLDGLRILCSIAFVLRVMEKNEGAFVNSIARVLHFNREMILLPIIENHFTTLFLAIARVRKNDQSCTRVVDGENGESACCF